MEEADPPTMLDPQIWGSIPQELLVKVLSRLPVSVICRFRSVCKKFNQLPLEAHFARLQTGVSSPCFLCFKAPWLVCTSQEVVYVERSGKWFSIPVSYLPSDFTLRASRGGLLVFCDRQSHKKDFAAEVSLVVCNPITREWKKLVKSAVREICHLDIDVGESNCDFKVLVAGWTGPDRSHGLIEVYDSQTDTWDELLIFSGEDEVGTLDKLRCLAVLNGTLYLVVQSVMDASLRMVVINLSTQAERRVVDGLGAWWTVDCLGKLGDDLIVVGRKYRGSTIDVWLWTQGEDKQNQWEVLDRLDNGKLSSSLFVRFAYAVGLVCICIEKDQMLALYDLRDRSWHWVDMPQRQKLGTGLMLLPFQPSFVPLNQAKLHNGSSLLSDHQMMVEDKVASKA